MDTIVVLEESVCLLLLLTSLALLVTSTVN